MEVEAKLRARNGKLRLKNKQIETEKGAKSNELENHMKKCGDILKETTENSKRFAIDTVNDTVNEIMDSLKQKLEDFEEDVAIKNPATSKFAKTFPQKLHDIGLPVPEKSSKRKKEASPQQAIQQRHRAS